MAASLDSPLSSSGSIPAPSGAVRQETGALDEAAKQASMAQDCADVEQALAGVEDAYSRLMRRYEEDIARQMWRFTRNAGERDELVQEVFVEAYLSLRSFRRKAPFLHWLRTIAIRRGYRFWKLREKRRRLVALEEWDGMTRPEQDPPPERAAEEAYRLLALLKPEERVVMTLEYLEGRSVEEVAALLGWTQAMVKMRAYRAKKKLRVMRPEGEQS